MKKLKIQITENKQKDLSSDIYRNNFKLTQFDEAFEYLSKVEECSSSPLVNLEKMGTHLGIKGLYIKDENRRCDLKSFKILGATYAVSKYLSGLIGEDINMINLDEIRDKCRERLKEKIIFTTCSDGNHGRAVAWAAAKMGFESVIYLNKGTDIARAEAIEELGGQAIITDLNYDDTVRLANENAEKNRWVIIQDTSWDGYKDVPLWIMRGYSKMLKESIDVLDMANIKPTHIFLQAGVGAMAGGAAAYMAARFYNEGIPNIIIVEPDDAACYFKSAYANDGHIHVIQDEMNSIMAGLSCGEPVKEGWEVISKYASFFLKCDDPVTVQGMRMLCNPFNGDESIISGESGAVSMGALYNIMSRSEYSNIKSDLKLNDESIVLIFSTEGDTAPLRYKKILWGV